MASAIPVVAAAVALVVTFAATPFARWLAVKLGWYDVPNERSSHTEPTPRLGGIAIVAGIAVALGLAGLFHDARIAVLFATAAALSVVGFIDDVRRLSEPVKLVFQLGAALALVFSILRAVSVPVTYAAALPLAAVMAVLWITGLTNAVNFMDGINGIAALQIAISAATCALFSLRDRDAALAAASATVAGAALGFLPWNFPKARIFMGDGGSLGLGLVLASLTLMLCRPGAHGRPLTVAALSLSPFLGDTAVTLVRRIARRERFLSAHRTHFYQRLIGTGFSHAGVTSIWAGLALVCAVLSLVVDAQQSDAALYGALAAVVVLHVALFAWIAYRCRPQVVAG